MGAVCCGQEEIDFTSEGIFPVELSHFYLLKIIGKGAFGKVRIVQHKSNLKQYALKYISKAKCIKKKAVENILTERKVLELIDYPLIVNLRYAFHDSENLFMVLDLMLGGDLRFQMGQHTRFTELQVRFFVADLVLALTFIHTHHIVHRDVKPDNILLDANGHAHLSDFNIATELTSAKPYRHAKAGSLSYMAPEVLNGTRYQYSVDFWSLGVTAYELIFGKRPFGGKTSEEVKDSILNQPLVFPEDILITSECKDVLTKMLDRNPKERLGAKGIQQFKTHPWFRDVIWDEMESKTTTSPFIPDSDESNFDAVHELEELLMDDSPLRPHKKATSETNTMKELIELDDSFLTYDYTKQASVDQSILPSNLLKKVGEVLDQTKYKAQGYHELESIKKSIKQT
ncbi:kinase-like protein [Backusella circina FSU 941]|nr:kinase-like protein [Backusella circina FSU 941]